MCHDFNRMFFSWWYTISIYILYILMEDVTVICYYTTCKV